jgi:hypothetical protein
MPQVQAQPIELVRVNSSTGRINIRVLDDDGVPTNATSVLLTVLDNDGGVVRTDDFSSPTTRIVNPSAGVYYFPIGNPTIIGTVTNEETTTVRDLHFEWVVTPGAGLEPISVVHSVWVVSVKSLSLLPRFRILIDKASLMVSDSFDDPVFLGYTDAQLMEYLRAGMACINSYQPYPAWAHLDDFPDLCYATLFEAALVYGAGMSQQLFAVATDIPNYSDQGNAFVIQHQPALAAFLTQISQRLDKIIPQMKLHYVRSGSLHIEAGPNYRLAHLITAAPGGAVFRGVSFSG